MTDALALRISCIFQWPKIAWFMIAQMKDGGSERYGRGRGKKANAVM
jgi:hypothetical protein